VRDREDERKEKTVGDGKVAREIVGELTTIFILPAQVPGQARSTE